MNIGTKFEITLIGDDRFEKDGTKDPQEQVNIKHNKLVEVLKGSGIEISSMSKDRFLTGWGKPTDKEYNTTQVRRHYWLELTKKLTSNQIYHIINQVSPQPLKIINNRSYV